MKRRNTTLAAATAALLVALALFAGSASATFEATLALRTPSARKAGPTFTVEAGGGRRTRILDFSIESGRCGSIYSPLIDAGQTTGGFAAGKGAATFTLVASHLKLRVELRLRPRGEGLRGDGLLDATVGTCHERVPLDLVSTEIRGGGRHT